jgi:hypothetical protein
MQRVAVDRAAAGGRAAAAGGALPARALIPHFQMAPPRSTVAAAPSRRAGQAGAGRGGGGRGAAAAAAAAAFVGAASQSEPVQAVLFDMASPAASPPVLPASQ